MTDTYAKLSHSLHRTRDSLVSACYVLGLNAELFDLSRLSVVQCADCSIWETHNNIIGDVCVFCHNMPDLRF